MALQQTQGTLLTMGVDAASDPDLIVKTKTGWNTMKRKFDTVAARRAFGRSDILAHAHLSKAMGRLAEQGIYLPMSKDMLEGEIAATAEISNLQEKDNEVGRLSLTPFAEFSYQRKEVAEGEDYEENIPSYDYNQGVLTKLKRRINTMSIQHPLDRKSDAVHAAKRKRDIEDEYGRYIKELRKQNSYLTQDLGGITEAAAGLVAMKRGDDSDSDDDVGGGYGAGGGGGGDGGDGGDGGGGGGGGNRRAVNDANLLLNLRTPRGGSVLFGSAGGPPPSGPGDEGSQPGNFVLDTGNNSMNPMIVNPGQPDTSVLTGMNNGGNIEPVEQTNIFQSARRKRSKRGGRNAYGTYVNPSSMYRQAEQDITDTTINLAGKGKGAAVPNNGVVTSTTIPVTGNTSNEAFRSTSAGAVASKAGLFSMDADINALFTRENQEIQPPIQGRGLVANNTLQRMGTASSVGPEAVTTSSEIQEMSDDDLRKMKFNDLRHLKPHDFFKERTMNGGKSGTDSLVPFRNEIYEAYISSDFNKLIQVSDSMDPDKVVHLIATYFRDPTFGGRYKRLLQSWYDKTKEIRKRKGNFNEEAHREQVQRKGLLNLWNEFLKAAKDKLYYK